MEPAVLWIEDPGGLAGRIGTARGSVVLRYPDRSTVRGESAFITGVSEIAYVPAVARIAVQTFADVYLDDDMDDGRFYAARLRQAVMVALEALEQKGLPVVAGELREAATLAGFPPPARNPLS